MKVEGMHHITMITGDAQKNVEFFADVRGLRLVKKTVNVDAPDAYHLYLGDEQGSPGSISPGSSQRRAAARRTRRRRARRRRRGDEHDLDRLADAQGEDAPALHLPDHAWSDVELMQKDIRLARRTAADLKTPLTSATVAEH